MTGRERFEAGDGLRGLAALSVAVGHALVFTLVLANAEYARPRPGAADVPPAAVELIALLSHAIWVFFALSGYLLARPFVAAYLDGKRRPGLRRYARNRALRIVPAFWAAVGITAVVRGTGDDGAREVLGTLLFLQTWTGGELARGIPQAYTLDIEAAFYLALPLAALALWALPRPASRPARRAVLLAAVALAALASVLVIAHVARTGAAWRALPHGLLGLYLVGFAPGLLLAVLEPDLRPRARPWWPAAALAVAAAAALGQALVPADRPLAERLLLATLGGALLAAPLVREWSRERPWLAGRATTWLGARSYSLYLVHLAVLLPLIDALDARGTGPLPSAAVAVGVGIPGALLAAHLLHAAVEAPALRLKRGRRPDPPLRAAAAAPPAASSSAAPR